MINPLFFLARDNLWTSYTYVSKVSKRMYIHIFPRSWNNMYAYWGGRRPTIKGGQGWRSPHRKKHVKKYSRPNLRNSRKERPLSGPSATGNWSKEGLLPGIKTSILSRWGGPQQRAAPLCNDGGAAASSFGWGIASILSFNWLRYCGYLEIFNPNQIHKYTKNEIMNQTSNSNQCFDWTN